MQRTVLVIVFVLVLATATGSGLAMPDVAVHSCEDPVPVVEAFGDAFDARDADGVLALLTDDAVLTYGDGTFTGKAEIEGWLEGHVSAGIQAKAGDLQVEGCTVIGTARMLVGDRLLTRSDEWLVEGDKIKALDLH